MCEPVPFVHCTEETLCEALRGAQETSMSDPRPTLHEHNREREQRARKLGTNILCPECRREMLDATPSKIMFTAPMVRIAVRCPGCGLTGWRYS